MLRRLPILALLLFVFCLQMFPIYANDLWMHLLLGRDILDSGVPHHEMYSYTAAGRPFVYHEWLAGVGMYLLHRVAGTTGLILLQPLTALLTALLLYRVAVRLGADRDLSILWIGLGLYVSAFRLFARPHLLAVPLLAAALLLLERYRSHGGWKDLAGLVILQVLWANLHGSFPEGVALAALFGAGELLRRRLLRPAEAAPAPALGFVLLPPLLLVASMINPYGWNLVRLVFQHPVDPLFRARIYEYFPPFGEVFRDTRLFLLYAGWLVLFGLALLVGRRRLDPAYLLPAAAFLGLSLWMNRAIPDLVVVSLPWMAVALSPVLNRTDAARWRWKPAAVAGILVAGSLGTLAFGYRFDDRAVRRFGLGVEAFTPTASTAYLEEAGFRGNIFCSFPHGAYLAWRLAPAARVVFDSRTIPYGTAVYMEYGRARSGLEGFLRHTARYAVDAVHLGFRLDGDPTLHEHLRGGRGWGLVHYDDDVALYLRDGGEAAALLARDRMACASPLRFDQVGIPEGEEACWERETRRVLERSPEATLPRFHLAVALRAQRRSAEALEEIGAVLALRPELAYAHRLRVDLLVDLGDAEGARQARAEAERLEE